MTAVKFKKNLSTGIFSRERPYLSQVSLNSTLVVLNNTLVSLDSTPVTPSSVSVSFSADLGIVASLVGCNTCLKLHVAV